MKYILLTNLFPSRYSSVALFLGHRLEQVCFLYPFSPCLNWIQEVQKRQLECGLAVGRLARRKQLPQWTRQQSYCTGREVLVSECPTCCGAIKAPCARSSPPPRLLGARQAPFPTGGLKMFKCYLLALPFLICEAMPAINSDAATGHDRERLKWHRLHVLWHWKWSLSSFLGALDLYLWALETQVWTVFVDIQWYTTVYSLSKPPLSFPQHVWWWSWPCRIRCEGAGLHHCPGFDWQHYICSWSACRSQDLRELLYILLYIYIIYCCEACSMFLSGFSCSLHPKCLRSRLASLQR